MHLLIYNILVCILMLFFVIANVACAIQRWNKISWLNIVAAILCAISFVLNLVITIAL